MRVKEYLSQFDVYTKVTLIVAKAVKDEHTPGYHPEYRTTPINMICEWRPSDLMDYHILNTKQCPIDWMSGAPWANDFKAGRLLSLLIISDEDMKTLYSEQQANELIEYIGNKIKKEMVA